MAKEGKKEKQEKMKKGDKVDKVEKGQKKKDKKEKKQESALKGISTLATPSTPSYTVILHANTDKIILPPTPPYFCKSSLNLENRQFSVLKPLNESRLQTRLLFDNNGRTTCSARPFPNPIIQYAIAIKDDVHRQVHIFQVPQFDFSLRLSSAASTELMEEEAEFDLQTLKKRRDMKIVGQVFGTKRKKQELKGRDRDVIHEESLSRTQAFLQARQS